MERTRPLLLRASLRRFEASEPKPGTAYDATRQLWINADGIPVVEAARTEQCASDFGETTVTTSAEGVDQSEGRGSDFGETTLTRTSEGTDKTEMLSSDFGETTVTKTSEGTDATETFSASDFGETTKTASREGSDQTEATQEN